MNKTIVSLSKDELALIQDHLNQVIEIDRKIKQFQRQIARERLDLEASFSNAVRREMIEQDRKGDVPRFIEFDGTINVQIDGDGIARWIEGREPKEKKPEKAVKREPNSTPKPK